VIAIAEEIRQFENIQQRIIGGKKSDRYHGDFQGAGAQCLDEITLRSELAGRMHHYFHSAVAFLLDELLELVRPDVFGMIRGGAGRDIHDDLVGGQSTP
jgi:hypothetical protein